MSRIRFFNSLVLFAMTLPAVPALAGPVENLQPGQWLEVSGTHMSTQDPCPSSNCVYSGNQRNVVNAWNSAAFDTQRNRLIVWGGGHSDYGGNEVYVFDIGTMTWSRLTNPSTNLSDDIDPYPDGLPNPRHTYGTPVYIPTADRYWVSGGSLWKIGNCGGDIWMYNFNASPPGSGWEHQVSTLQGEKFGDCGGSAAYDPGKDRVLLLSNLGTTAQLNSFNPNNRSAPWTTLNANAERKLYQSAVVDPVRRKLVVVGAGGTWTYNIDQSGAPRTALSTSGDRSAESSGGPGLAYDPVSDRVVAWIGGQNIYTLNMDTLVWEVRTATNSVNPGSVTASGGTWGRFQYIPSKNAYILVTSTEANVFFYKLSAAGGTPPPDKPSKPVVIVQ